MRFGIVFVGDFVAKFFSQFGKGKTDGAIDQRMARIVRAIMSQSAQAVSEFIQVGGFIYQIGYKIATANIMGQVAEEYVPKWIVSHVLNETASVGVGVRFLKFLFAGLWEPLQQERRNLILPHDIDEFLVS